MTEHMCDCIDYEIKDKLRTKKPIEVEEPKLEKSEEQPITVVQ
jgi:hypothetical protein